MARFLPERPDPGQSIEPYQAGLRCACPSWPCTSSTCTRCTACERHGGPLITGAEERWLDTGKGLSKQEAENLRKLSHAHGSSGYKAKNDARGAA